MQFCNAVIGNVMMSLSMPGNAALQRPPSCKVSVKSVCAEDLGHLVQSPATHVMARSLSEIVQQLYANDQLSQDCGHALSMQLGGTDSISRQQMQGNIAFSAEVSAPINEFSRPGKPSMGLPHIWPDGRCIVTLHSLLKSVHSQVSLMPIHTTALLARWQMPAAPSEFEL